MNGARVAGAALLFAGAALGLAATAARAQEPDPFYDDLERAGSVALAGGDARAAARKLRLACFGQLDRPDRLAGCLVRLAVAQARSGDSTGFAHTFERLVVLEDRFDAWSSAGVDAALRDELELAALAVLPAAMLAGAPPPAGCGRAVATLRLGRADEAVAAFATCGPERHARFAAPALEAWLGLGRLDEARAFADRLSPGVQADREVAQQMAELAKRERRRR